MEELKTCSYCRYFELEDYEEPCISCKHGVSPTDPKYETAELKRESKDSHIRDSGNRREFASGAVRDIDTAKGRCDLLPLEIVSDILNDQFLLFVERFLDDGMDGHITDAIKKFAENRNWDLATAMLEVSIHFKDGAEKYEERNWEKGIPAHCYVDSAIRHYLKWLRGDDDERHDRAVLWNLMCLLWTVEHRPEMNDLPLKW